MLWLMLIVCCAVLSAMLHREDRHHRCLDRWEEERQMALDRWKDGPTA